MVFPLVIGKEISQMWAEDESWADEYMNQNKKCFDLCSWDFLHQTFTPVGEELDNQSAYAKVNVYMSTFECYKC